MSSSVQDRTESIVRANHPDVKELAPGIRGRLMASSACGAINLCTAIADLSPRAQSSYHRHSFSEVVTPLKGPVVVSVEGRRYRLRPFESIHIPAGVVHTAYGESNVVAAVVHSAFASSSPTREFVAGRFPFQDLGCGSARPGDPEFVARRELVETYELNKGAFFRDLFASRYGSKGICGGYARFETGSSLPCHIHQYDESITIVEGSAICEVAGRRYILSDNDTALVPRGLPHRFLNESRGPMAMVWVYAGDEPERSLLRPTFCQGCESCSCRDKPGGHECICKAS